MSPLPSVEPLPPGARPTEPGWYVVRYSAAKRHIVELHQSEGSPKTLYVWGTWSSGTYDVDIDEFTFIARIYPDRIGQE